MDGRAAASPVRRSSTASPARPSTAAASAVSPARSSTAASAAAAAAASTAALSPKKVRGTAPLSTTPYCSRSPTRRLSAPSSPPPLNGVATVPSPQRRTSGAALSPGGRGSPWSLAAAEEEEEEEEEGATVGGEAEHLALREIWRGCISALDLRDLPALHGHAPPLRRLVWRHFETLFFTFTAFAVRGPRDSWRMDKRRFGEVCASHTLSKSVLYLK